VGEGLVDAVGEAVGACRLIAVGDGFGFGAVEDVEVGRADGAAPEPLDDPAVELAREPVVTDEVLVGAGTARGTTARADGDAVAAGANVAGPFAAPGTGAADRSRAAAICSDPAAGAGA
jgi:hypothetical protein